MAGKKAEKNLEEEVLRYIYNSRFYPDNVVNEDGPAFMFDNDLLGMIDNAKSYDEARNILIGALDDEKNLQLARNATRDYLESFGEEGNLYDWEKSFSSPLERVPLNVDALPYETVEERADKFAKALSYSDINGMINNLNKNTVMGKWGLPELSDGFKIALREELKDKLKNGTLTMQSLDSLLDYSPNADEDYILNKAFEYADRVNRRKSHEKMGGGSKLAQSFMQPYSFEATAEGLKPSAMDLLFDAGEIAGTPFVGAKLSKMSNGARKIEKAVENAAKPLDNLKNTFLTLSGIGAVAGAVEPFITRAHDGLDALFSKNVYANEGTDNEVSERGDFWNALRLDELPTDVKNGVANGIMSSAVGLGGRGGGRVLKGLGDKIASTGVGKKVLTGLDALFGGSGKGKAKKAYGDLMNEKKAIEGRIEDWTRNPKSTVSDEAKRQYDKRLSQIERHQGAFEKAYEKAAQNAGKTAYDALVYSALVKAGLSPEITAKNLANDLYSVEYFKNR